MSETVKEGEKGSAATSLREIAELVEGRVEGDEEVRVHDLVPVAEAGPGELGYLSQKRYVKHLAASRAEALLVHEALVRDLALGDHLPLVVVANPALALARLVDHFHPEVEHPAGIHPTAVLGTGVRLGEGVTIGPYAVIEGGAVLGDRVRIGAHAVVGRGTKIGEDTVLHPHVVLYPGSLLGRRVIIHSGARIGSDGFGYVFHESEHRKVRQVGGCTIEDDVEIGANTCIDRGSIGRTTVGKGSKLDNLVHLGHNVVVGERVLLVAQVGVSGSCRIADGAVLGGQVGVSGHLEIGEGARVGGQAGVIKDVPAGETVSGFPARPHGEFMRAMAALFKIPDLIRRVRALERSGRGEGAETHRSANGK